MKRFPISPALRRVLLVGGACMALVSVICLGLVLILTTQAGLRILERTVNTVQSTAHISGLRGNLLGRFSLDQISLTDTNGTWLTVQNIDCEWTPMHLLHKELHIPFVRITKADVARLPSGETSSKIKTTDKQKPATEPSFLPALTLSEVHIAHLLLGSDTPQPIPAMTLTGSATIASPVGPGQIELYLHALDKDTPKLSLTALVEKNTLQCSGTFDDPTGYMVSFLAAYSDPLPLHIRFQGSGLAGRYEGTIEAHAPTLGTTDLNMVWTVPEHNGSLRGTFSLEPEGKLAALAGFVGEKVDVALGTDKHGRLLQNTLELSSRWIQFSASSSVDLEKNTTDTTFRLTHADPDRVTKPLGIILEKLEPVTGSIRGSLARPAMFCSLSAGSLQSGQTFVEHPTIILKAGPSTAKQQQYSATLNITTDNIRIPDILHSGPLTLHTVVDGLDEEIMQARMEASSKNLTLKGSGSFTPGSGILSATFSGNALPEALLSSGVGPLPQSVALSGTIQGDVNKKKGAAELQAVAGRFTKAPAHLEALLGPAPTLTLSTTLDENNLYLQELTFTGTGINAQGNATLHLQSGEYQANLRGRVQTTALGENLAHLKEISLAAQATGNSDHVSCTLTAHPGTPLTFGLPLESVLVDATLNHLGATPEGTWAVNLATTPGPLDLGGDLKLKNGLAIPHGTLKGLGLDGTFRLDFPADTSQTRLHFNITSSSLASVGTLLNQPLEGSVDLTGSYMDRQGSALVTLSGSARNLAYGDLVNLGSADLKRLSLDPTRPDQPDLDLHINDLATGALRLEKIHLQTTRQNQGMDIALTTEGTQPAPLTLSLTGHILSAPAKTSLHLNTLQGTYNGFPVQLKGPTELRSTGDMLELTPATLALGDGTLTAQGHKDIHNVNASVDLTKITLTSLQLLAPFSLPTGILTAHGSLTGPLEHPKLQTNILVEKLAPIHPPDAEDTFFGTVHLAAETTQNKLIATGSLEGLGSQPFQLTGAIPFALSLRPFQTSISETAPMQITAQGNISLEKISDLLAVPDLDLSGDLEVDASATGTLAKPELAGTIHLDHGRAEYVRTGTLLEQMEALIRLDNHRLILEKFSATDGEKGRLSAMGGVTLPINAPLVYEISAKLHDARLITNDTVTAQVNGTCRVHTDANSTSVQGDLSIPRAQVDISRNTDPNLVPVKVREINVQPEYQVEEPAAKASPPTNINLNVAVTIPGQLFVRGRGLESEWKGKLHIKGTAAAPVITGTLASIRGYLSFAGRDLNLTEGKIQFDGAVPPNPLLNIATSTTIKSTEVQVKVEGSAQKPDLLLEASPSIPEDEILALLLFGESAAQLNPMQALQLANTARTLAGSSGKGGFDPMGFTRSLLGVDTIKIGSDDDDEGMQLGLGKYLTDSIYVELEKGLTSDEDTVSVDMELTPNIGVETEVGTDSTGKAGVYWKRDY